jgi:hypothetical protein
VLQERIELPILEHKSLKLLPNIASPLGFVYQPCAHNSTAFSLKQECDDRGTKSSQSESKRLVDKLGQ